LIADLAPERVRGASFGLRQSLDTVGAFLGPLLAIVLMWLSADNFQAVFWLAVLPAFLSMALIVFGVSEPDRPAGLRRVDWPVSLAELKRLGAAYWWVVAVAAVFTLARFSEAFLLLRAQSTGLAVMLVPGVLVIMNVVYAAAAYPAGVLSDNGDRGRVLIAGFAMLIVADLVLAAGPSTWGVLAGVALWGLHMGFTQGLLAALVADTVPPELRGTAFGMFNLVSGLALLAASVLAGALWEAIGPQATFLAGAAFAAVALAGLLFLRRRGMARLAGQPR
jgi:MFS family permease